MEEYVKPFQPVNGIIPITQAISVDYPDRYDDAKRGVPDVWWGRIVAKIFAVLLKYQNSILGIDFRMGLVRPGEYFPWYSASYWWGKPLIWMGRHGIKVHPIDGRRI